MKMFLKVFSRFMIHAKGPGLGEGGFSLLRAYCRCFKDSEASRMPTAGKAQEAGPEEAAGTSAVWMKDETSARGRGSV